ncbi:uncharacterized protein TRIVIDRAFT_79522 [Trichoderma virens Gv29-8]|uniref:GPI anchored serine-threonine rich protein n=1 Tax=Hypocrea virens (strain Gv29-8 / FGSC 10586) TaxID=413071 RepID=G9MDK1_HYPVG|nr:uncharacterized protein TRIVIDRAFT_79522 [Trichoderma virens Gv29-8]EHK27515.1 hypothetical protein TRIVIDRAFT_79522 [Trichoderma virens Gv29-8]UKZ57617.1 hypothetical protein TrVGV298_011477 [Trichoderma virens]UKZ83327.1 hypothetical protein TrVFT333_011135 [Trichoderma virens FT-333]
MKFFATLLFAAVGVSAASSATSPDTPGSTCLADYILEDCLNSTTKTANACKPTDYDCLCAAYQAVLTCYNNCPNDIRAPSVQQQVDSYCRTASLLSPKTTASTPKTKTQDSSNSQETSSDSAPSNDDTSATDAGPTQTGASRTSATTAARSSSSNAAATMGSVAGLVMAVAGAAAAMI